MTDNCKEEAAGSLSIETPVETPAAAPIAAPGAAVRKPRKGRLDARGWAIVWVLLSLPLLLVMYRASSLPGSAVLDGWLSLHDLPHEMRSRVMHLLMAPLGALIVVFVRLTLGLRVLGPFRSVLLAVAFQVTGMLVGLAFFALVLCVVVMLKPVFKRMRLPFFGRSSAMLASVSTVILLTMMVGMILGVPEVEHVAYFPVVVLTLSGDAFASALKKEGTKVALWRAGSTAATAMVITGLAFVEAIREALLEHTELQLMILGSIILVCEMLNYKIFAWLNPKPPKKSRTGKKSSVTTK